jgi:hypothetical protein
MDNFFLFNYYFIIMYADYIHPLSSSVMMLNHLMCDKVEFPCCGEPIAGGGIFQKNCSMEDCASCKAFALTSRCVLSCPTLFSEEKNYVWKEFTKVTRDNNSIGTELREKVGNGMELKAVLLTQLTKYKEHYFKYRWLHFCRKHDILQNISPTTIYIQSDFSAQPKMQSQSKLNCEADGVCCLCCAVVLHSPKHMTFTDENDIDVDFVYFEVDHIRVVSSSSGKCKDQDWFLHCNVMKFLVEKYRDEIPGLSLIILWTDGAPNQYKCRQNFLWVAFAIDLFGVQIIHRFGATSQFKGVHDKIGQVAKWVVKLKEKYGIERCSTAFEFYLAVKRHLIFQKHFDTPEAKFKKGQFEATRYEIYYAASSAQDAEGKPVEDIHMI